MYGNLFNIRSSGQLSAFLESVWYCNHDFLYIVPKFPGTLVPFSPIRNPMVKYHEAWLSMTQLNKMAQEKLCLSEDHLAKGRYKMTQKQLAMWEATSHEKSLMA